MNNMHFPKVLYQLMFLLSSNNVASVFRDGTTDVTRTFHYGTPTDLERVHVIIRHRWHTIRMQTCKPVHMCCVPSRQISLPLTTTSTNNNIKLKQ